MTIDLLKTPRYGRVSKYWLIQGRCPGPSIIKATEEYAVFLAQHHGYLIQPLDAHKPRVNQAA